MQSCQRLSHPFVGSVEAVSDCRVVLCMCPYQVTVQDASTFSLPNSVTPILL